MARDYDHLFKLLIIGDSGEWLDGQLTVLPVHQDRHIVSQKLENSAKLGWESVVRKGFHIAECLWEMWGTLS